MALKKSALRVEVRARSDYLCGFWILTVTQKDFFYYSPNLKKMFNNPNFFHVFLKNIIPKLNKLMFLQK